MKRDQKRKQYIIYGGMALLIVAAVVAGILLSGPSVETAIADAEESILATYRSLSPAAQKFYYKQSEGLTKPVDPRLVELDQLKIGCFGPQNVMQMSTAEGNLGGQCCGVLKDADAYIVQLQALDRFIEENDNLDFIPRDPYDVPVAQAQQLTMWDAEIRLSAAQQAVYDNAIKVSHHKGPCCCKCWKWYVMSGLAKKLIVDHGWSSEKVAELWDTSSSCGHEEDTNMHQHYGVDATESDAGHHGDEGMMHSTSESETLKISFDEKIAQEGPSVLKLTISDDGTPAQLHTHHGRQVHVVLLSESLDWFGHIHPEDFPSLNADTVEGEYVVAYEFPIGGEFLLSADVMSESGVGSEQFTVSAQGEAQGQKRIDAATEKCFSPLSEAGTDRYVEPISLTAQEVTCPEGYQVTISHSALKAGVPARLQFKVSKSGELLDDLSAYLEAPLHLAVVRVDLEHFMHEHGEGQSSDGHSHSPSDTHFGPHLESEPIVLPEPGTYVIIPQMKRGNELIIGRFFVEVN